MQRKHGLKVAAVVAALISAVGFGTKESGGRPAKSYGPKTSSRRRKFKGYQRQHSRRRK